MNCRIPASQAAAVVPSYAEVMERTRAGAAMMKYNRAHGFEPNEAKQLAEPDMSNIYFSNPEGCSQCFQGRSGRTVLVEIVDADSQVMTYLRNAEMDKAREYWLSPKPQGLGGTSMLWHGIEKVMAGMLSPLDTEFELGPLATEQEINEVRRVLGAKYES